MSSTNLWTLVLIIIMPLASYKILFIVIGFSTIHSAMKSAIKVELALSLTLHPHVVRTPAVSFMTVEFRKVLVAFLRGLV